MTTTSISVRRLEEADCAKWNEFVYKQAQGSPFHLIAWRNAIQKTFGYVPLYAAAWEADRICAVLPLFLVDNILIGKALISSPFAVYGGILADSEGARDELYSYTRELGHRLQVEYVELRNGYPEQCTGESNVNRYVTFTQKLEETEEKTLEAIPRKTRAAVRKSLKQGFESRSHRGDINAFERLYSENLQRLGTPSFPRQHFTNLLEAFGEEIDIREVVFKGNVVAAVMTLYFRDQVLPYYGASDPRYNEFSPNNFMYFDLMRSTGNSGFKCFDFGRSKRETGSFDFKAHWGMEMRNLPYEMMLVRRKSVPDFSPKNPKFSLPIRIWQHLPLPVTRLIGPSLLRLIP